MGGAGAAVATSSGSGSDGASGWLSSAIPDLPQRLFGALTGRSAPPPPPNPEIASSVAATQAAVAALDRSVRAQSGSRTAVVVFGAAVGGLGLAIYTFGGERGGWVSGSQLKAGLEGVRASVEAMLARLREELLAQLETVHEKLRELTDSLGKVRASRGREEGRRALRRRGGR